MRKAIVAIAALVISTSGSSAPRTAAKAPPDWKTILAAAHDNGYQDGYLAGYDAGNNGDRLKQCNTSLNYLVSRVADAKRYEACLTNLKAATFGPDSYLRQVASQCVSELR